MVTRIFQNFAKSDRAVRFAVRMLPLDFICSPHPKPFQAAAAAAIPKALAEAKEGATWYLKFQSRAMGTLQQQEVVQIVKDIMAPLKLELSVCDAEYIVVVEVNPALCGFSV